LRYLLLASALFACSSGAEGPPPLPPLPPLSAAPLVDARVLSLVHPVEPQGARSPADPSQLQGLLRDGFGDLVAGPGATAVVHTVDDAPPPAIGAAPKLLVRFVHLADAQLADDESPARTVSVDAMGDTSAAFRPQEAWGCRMLNAAVRTVNAVHLKTPIELVVVGGDNADNAQQNEVTWFSTVLGGAASAECDSGEDDDPILGPDNDPKDPFVAAGLAMRWLWVTGNHDILGQGNFRILPDSRASFIGTEATLGTRDWRLPGAPTTNGPVPADPRREPLTRSALMAMVAADADGHGVRGVADGKAFYASDTAGGAVRFIAVDTAAETGGSSGVIHRPDLMMRVKPLLDAALADGVAVILTSHHAAGSLGDGSGFAGTVQPDAITTEAWRAFVGGYPNVIMHLAAHSHRFRTRVARPAGGHAYFEYQTSSLADWPSQLSVIEVWDQDDGFLMIRSTPFDYADEGDPLVTEARRRTAADFTSGWSNVGVEESGFVELWIAKP